MLLGNLTSQFLANVYPNELDQFVKQMLKVKYYIRYVDDFVILHQNRNVLEDYNEKIHQFLKRELFIKLNQDKSTIKPLSRGVDFLGFKFFYHHKLLKMRNIRKFYRKNLTFYDMYSEKEVNYDSIYDFIEGWIAYARHANTYSRIERLQEPIYRHLYFIPESARQSRENNLFCLPVFPAFLVFPA